MRDLNGIDFDGGRIIEHRKSERDVVGRIEYAGINNGGASIGIGWTSRDGGNRTQCFATTSWQADVRTDHGIIFFRRLRPDTSDLDIPWRDADLYTVILPEPKGRR